MSLDAGIVSLRRGIAKLQEVLSALRITVIEDRPTHGAVVLVDRLDNLVTDLSSMLEEADARAAQALRDSSPHGPLESVRAAVRDIHELLNRFTASYVGGLAAHDHIAQLLDMGRGRGREWREWSAEVKTAIDRCVAPMEAVGVGLAECWSELAERLARQSVSVQATNIGQQIAVRDDQWDASAKIT